LLDVHFVKAHWIAQRPKPTGPFRANSDITAIIGHCENLRWQIEAERFRSFKIDHELELRYSHHRQISGLLAP
jgi:hypothetical protein